LNADQYRDILRVRASGLLFENDRILLARLNVPTREQPVWMPPGGSVKAGEYLEAALEREFREETGLEVKSGRMVMVHEFIEPPLHALEIYFLCTITGGGLRLGRDPEHAEEDQILLDLQFVPFEKLKSLDLYPEILKKKIVDFSKGTTEVLHVSSRDPQGG
jgi:8-oxo-dGTP diphosphatase